MNPDFNNYNPNGNEPNVQPVPPVTPQPVVQPEPSVQPQPTVQPQPVVMPEPVVQAPVQPVVAPAPVVEPQPTVQPQPVVMPEPVVQAPVQPVVAPAPVVEPQPVVQPQPIVQPQPVVQPEPVVGPQPQQQEPKKKKSPVVIIVIIILLLLILGALAYFFLIKPKLNPQQSGNSNNTVTNTNEVKEVKPDKNLIIAQVEEKLSENYTKIFNKANGVNYDYVGIVDVETFVHSSEYSSDPDDFYYLMEATIKNSSTGFIMSKVMARCKWNSETELIYDYGDTSRLSVFFGVVEEVIEGLHQGHGFMYLPQDQFSKDEAWNTDVFELKDFSKVASNFKLEYLYYEMLANKNEDYLQTMKNAQIADLKRIIEFDELDMHIVEVITTDDLSTSFKIAENLGSSVRIGDNYAWQDFLEYVQNLGIYTDEKYYDNKGVSLS